jgi:uncharacterized protein YhhL (DUF1145 family)
MENENVYAVGKGILGATWLFATACFFPPLENGAAAGFGQSLFAVLVIVHAVECVAFLGLLRKTGRPLLGELWQTFLFGIVHVSRVRAEIAASRDSR